ncbi:Tho2 protein [Saccharomycopsis crataegensis]|uniref:THO complex subunit 2 n=1 Tax=Saccharomycopsis crataegensis TaxID=43959 RepID=A0AAV5QUS4_9ASCO|nr:Tho2 protein [Saccharomycopsis crataegensis]
MSSGSNNADDDGPLWVWFSPEDIPKTGDPAYVDKLYKEIVGTNSNHFENEKLGVFFYEFLFIFSSLELFPSDTSATKFINAFLKKSGTYVNNDLGICFIQMLNTFPPENYHIANLISYCDVFRQTLKKYLRSDLAKASRIIDGYAKKSITFARGQSKIKNYNLLYECSEGYSKLIVEVFEAINSPDALLMTQYVNEVILKLIGTYSLDPNRVLDVILDIFTANLSKNYKFCIQLLRKSLWWPKVEASADCHNLDSLSIGGSAIGAQLLGLKVLNPTMTNKPNSSEMVKYLVVMLIKEGFISFGSFFHYLTPDDSEFPNLEGQFKEYMNDKIFKATASALALAAPLKLDDEENNSNNNNDNNSNNPGGNTGSTSGGRPAAGDVNDEKYQPLGGKINLKYEFLKLFLLFGCYDEAIFLLTKYPVLAQMSDEIPHHIHRLFQACADDFYYENYHPIKDQAVKNSLMSKSMIGFLRDNNYIDYDHQKTKLIDTFKLPAGDNKSVFFYRNWDRALPKIKSIDELFSLANELLSFSGAKLALDGELITKLVRIGIKDITDNGKSKESGEITEEEYKTIQDKWLQFFRKFIFVAIPLMGTNSPLVEMTFSLFALFPTHARYNLYGELEMKLKKRNLFINLEYDQATKKTKDGLKRLSKTNANAIMRNLSKISFSNPLPFFQVITTQVESYDNLIDLIVLSARYYNAYAWDVLSYVLLTRLTSRRNFVQSDGLNDRLWLQNLSSFIGKLCVNYPSNFNFEIIVEFISRRLYEFDNITIILFKEIINNVSGIANISNLTMSQIDLLSSGAKSVARTVYNVIFDKRASTLCSNASLKFLQSLISTDAKDAEIFNSNEQDISKLSELFILLTEYYKQQVYLDRSGENHSKILSLRNDELNGLIHTYITMLNHFCPSQEFLANNLLSLESLLFEHKIDIEWAFELWRGSMAAPPVKKTVAGKSAANPWSKLLNPISKAIMKDERFQYIDWKGLSGELFVSFWQMSLYDINYCSKNYEIGDKLVHQISGLEKSINNRVSSLSKDMVQKKKLEKIELESMLKNLESDKLAHKTHDAMIQKRIKAEKKTWFSGKKDTKLQAKVFIENCLLPRLIHSPFDAIYCAKFLILLLKESSEVFQTVSLEILNVLFSDVICSTIFSSTPQEAENFGLFFSKVLEYLNSLRIKKVFFMEKLGIELPKEETKKTEDDGEKPGNEEEKNVISEPQDDGDDNNEDVEMKEGDDNNDDDDDGYNNKNENEAKFENQDEDEVDDEAEEGDLAIFNEYTLQLYGWHSQTVSAIISCLQNHDYMYRRNAITFLKNLVGYFPVVIDHCEELLEQIETIFVNDEREDIRLASSAIIGLLKSKQAEWVAVYDFYKMPLSEKKAYNATKQKAAEELKSLQDELKIEKQIKRTEESKLREIEEEEKREEERLRREAEAKEKEKEEAEAEAKRAEEEEKKKNEENEKEQPEEETTENNDEPTDVDRKEPLAKPTGENSVKSTEKSVSGDGKDNSSIPGNKAASSNKPSNERSGRFVDVMATNKPVAGATTTAAAGSAGNSKTAGKPDNNQTTSRTSAYRLDTKSTSNKRPREGQNFDEPSKKKKISFPTGPASSSRDGYRGNNGGGSGRSSYSGGGGSGGSSYSGGGNEGGFRNGGRRDNGKNDGRRDNRREGGKRGGGNYYSGKR